MFVATWSGIDDSRDESGSNEEQVNLCLMAKEYEWEEESEYEVNNYESYTFDELQCAFESLMEEFEKGFFKKSCFKETIMPFEK